MKRILCVLLALCLLLALTACRTEKSPEVTSQPTETQSPTEPSETEEPTQTTAPEESTDDTQAPKEPSGDDQWAYSYADDAGRIWAMGFAKVTNDTDSPILTQPCTFRFCDESGAELFTAKDVSCYPQILEIGETGYYFEIVETGLAEVTPLKLTVEGGEPVTFQGGTRYETVNVNMSNSPYGGILISGEVRNSTSDTGELVCIAAIVYDAGDRPLCVLSTILGEALPANSLAGFSLENYDLPPELNVSEAANFEIFAYPVA